MTNDSVFIKFIRWLDFVVIMKKRDLLIELKLKQRVQQKISEYNGENTYSKEVLREMITSVLAEMEHSTDLFEKLLLTYPKRLTAVEEAHGGQTCF